MLPPLTKIQTVTRTVSFSNKKGNTFIANLLFLVVIVFMFSFNGAFAAGSVSSKQEKTSTTHSKEYYKAVKLIKANKFKDAIIILESLVTECLIESSIAPSVISPPWRCTIGIFKIRAL